jgi:hypothetical protein
MDAPTLSVMYTTVRGPYALRIEVATLTERTAHIGDLKMQV